MPRRTPSLTRIGTTTAGQPVYRDAFRWLDQYGIPLPLVLESARRHGAVFALDAFWYDAANAGWTHRRIDSTLRSAVSEIYGAEGRAALDRWLERHASAAR